jgi:hypothetical protein
LLDQHYSKNLQLEDYSAPSFTAPVEVTNPDILQIEVILKLAGLERSLAIEIHKTRDVIDIHSKVNAWLLKVIPKDT